MYISHTHTHTNSTHNDAQHSVTPSRNHRTSAHSSHSLTHIHCDRHLSPISLTTCVCLYAYMCVCEMDAMSYWANTCIFALLLLMWLFYYIISIPCRSPSSCLCVIREREVWVSERRSRGEWVSEWMVWAQYTWVLMDITDIIIILYWGLCETIWLWVVPGALLIFCCAS